MIFAACSTASQGGQQLPTGQSLSTLVAPGARFDARVTRVGPHPHYIANGAAAMVISPDRRQILLMTSGFNRYNGTDGKVVPDQSQQYILLYTIDARGSRLRQTLRVLNSYSGIAWLPDGAGFVVGGGVDDAVHRFARRGSAFAEIAPPIALGHKSGNGAAVKPQAAGIAVSADGCRAIVANYYNDSVSLIDLAGGRVLAEQDLRPGKIDAADSGKPGGEFPFAAAWTNAGEAWVSAPRDRQLVAFSISADTLKVTRRIATIGEPTALLHDRAAHRLYATEDNADRLTIVDLATGRMIAEPRFGFPAALGGDPVRKGLDPNAIAQTRDGRLLVTLGGVNALAVVAPT